MKRLIILISLVLLNCACIKFDFKEPYQPKEIMSFETKGHFWEYVETESIWSYHRDVDYIEKKNIFSLNIQAESSNLSPDSNSIYVDLVFDSIQHIDDFNRENLRIAEVGTFLDHQETSTYENLLWFKFNVTHFDPEHNFDRSKPKYGSIKANFSFRLTNLPEDTLTITNGLIEYEFYMGSD